ncbi:MAG TPA: DUF5666 domain-containing protein [Patescibacteria group bacterium]|nr:DUF5666 domain-containing protein [Patescibacteria group bacterium]
MKNTKMVMILVGLIALGAGFGGGYYFKTFQQNKARGNFATGANFQRFTGTRGGMQNGMVRPGSTQGTILSMDDKSVTVKMMDGTSRIVLFTDSTTYSNTVTAAKSDLKVGSTIAVFGAPNSDGSVSATSIQINPFFGKMTIGSQPSK